MVAIYCNTIYITSTDKDMNNNENESMVIDLMCHCKTGNNLVFLRKEDKKINDKLTLCQLWLQHDIMFQHLWMRSI